MGGQEGRSNTYGPVLEAVYCFIINSVSPMSGTVPGSARRLSKCF